MSSTSSVAAAIRKYSPKRQMPVDGFFFIDWAMKTELRQMMSLHDRAVDQWEGTLKWQKQREQSRGEKEEEVIVVGRIKGYKIDMSKIRSQDILEVFDAHSGELEELSLVFDVESGRIRDDVVCDIGDDNNSLRDETIDDCTILYVSEVLINQKEYRGLGLGLYMIDELDEKICTDYWTLTVLCPASLEPKEGEEWMKAHQKLRKYYSLLGMKSLGDKFVGRWCVHKLSKLENICPHLFQSTDDDIITRPEKKQKVFDSGDNKIKKSVSDLEMDENMKKDVETEEETATATTIGKNIVGNKKDDQGEYSEVSITSTKRKQQVVPRGEFSVDWSMRSHLNERKKSARKCVDRWEGKLKFYSYGDGPGSGNYEEIGVIACLKICGGHCHVREYTDEDICDGDTTLQELCDLIESDDSDNIRNDVGVVEGILDDFTMYITKIVIEPNYRGIGLGLYLVDEACTKINGRLSLTFLRPVPLNDFGRPMMIKKKDDNNNKELMRAEEKLRKYFERISMHALGDTFVARSGNPPLPVQHICPDLFLRFC